MKYATWQLEFIDGYGTGPEQTIHELGGKAEGRFVKGKITDLGIILGYVTGDFDASSLSRWNYQELTQTQALAFVQELDLTAAVNFDGKIITEIKGE